MDRDDFIKSLNEIKEMKEENTLSLNDGGHVCCIFHQLRVHRATYRQSPEYLVHAGNSLDEETTKNSSWFMVRLWSQHDPPPLPDPSPNQISQFDLPI